MKGSVSGSKAIDAASFWIQRENEGGQVLVEYYAKSRKRRLPDTEKEKIAASIENLLINLDGELEEWEKKTLLEAEKTIFQDCAEAQKTVREHLDETVSCAERFFEQYGMFFTEEEKILVITACRYHDLGKLNLIFQQMINPEIRGSGKRMQEKQIPHGYLSAVSISKKDFLKEYPEISEEDFYIMITAIWYHHTRPDNFNSNAIRKYCEKYYAEAVAEYLGKATWKATCMNRSQLLFENKITSENLPPEERKWYKYLLVKGLLNKFDWTVSAGYEEGEIHPDREKKELKNAIERRLSESLRPAQTYMREHKEDNLIIIAPTGSGKTEAALLWIDGEKSFYTLPLKVSSNAIYDRIRNQYTFKDVSLLHSDSMTKYFEEAAGEESAEEKDAYSRYEKAKLLSAPLTICTVDQLFKFVYKALGTEIFPATLKYSKLVLDEIQAYSPRVVASILYGLKTITAMGGRFAIITATFPPVLQMFMEKYGMVQGEQYLLRDFAREAVSARHIATFRAGEMDVEEIADAGSEKKVLVICNTVTKAQEIYEKINNLTENVYLLHSRFIRKDRAILEENIMEFSRNRNARGIWVTTQIVEASLDIDFDILYTEMCPADSLLQRMGRCNRAERYEPDEPNIIVFDNENGVETIYNRELYRRSVEFLDLYREQIFTEKMKAEYIERVYDAEEIQNTSYYREIEEYLQHFSTLHPLEYSKEEADEQFRKIDSITVVPDSVYEEYRNVFEECRQLIDTPHIGPVVKSVLRAKMTSVTMSMNLFCGRYPEGVDHAPVDGTAIHRANLVYDFDSEKMKGRGLILAKKKDEDYFMF